MGEEEDPKLNGPLVFIKTSMNEKGLKDKNCSNRKKWHLGIG